MEFQSNLPQNSGKQPGNISQWLPSRGNVIFTVFFVAVILWLQATGAFAVLSASSAANNNVNRAIPYQGRLADNAGNPLTATYPMIFRLYSESSGGVPLWEEQWTGPNSVAVSDGLFNVMLGNLIPISQNVFTENANLWLGITVGTDDEMLPRVQIGNVPFAVQANTVIDGSITAEKLAEGAIPPGVPVGTVISWWRPDANTPLPSGEWAIADGSTVTDTDSPMYGKTLPDLRNRFVMGVSAANIGQVGGSNTVNLSHNHQVDSHTHTIPSHAHSDGELYANVSVEDDRVYVKRYGPRFNASNANYTGSSHSNTHYTDASADVGGITGYWSGTSDVSAPYTSFSLSATTDNRPQYYGLIFLVRIK